MKILLLLSIIFSLQFFLISSKEIIDIDFPIFQSIVNSTWLNEIEKIHCVSFLKDICSIDQIDRNKIQPLIDFFNQKERPIITQKDVDVLQDIFPCTCRIIIETSSCETSDDCLCYFDYIPPVLIN